MRNLNGLILILFFIGCEGNHDLVIQEAAENCSCTPPVREIYLKEVGDRMSKQGLTSYIRVGCDNPFVKENDTKKIFSQTKTMEVFNQSETKIYKVTIQYRDSGKVRYADFNIEPTQNIILGCNYSFDPKLDSSHEELDIDNIKLTNLKPLEYKIHKVSIVDEY